MKSVRIADLKAHLSEHLREVRRGHPLIVMDRETPIARIIPYSRGADSLPARKPLGRYPSLQRVPLPAPLDAGIDVVDMLLEERQGDR